MILYNHAYDNRKNEIVIRAVEVIETPKTYKTVKHGSLKFCTSCIHKSCIDVFEPRHGSFYMVSLQPRPQKFKEHIQYYFECRYEENIRRANSYTQCLETLENCSVQEVGVDND